MSIKPWICNGSRTIVKDRWIDLHADDCALPDGTKISPFYVNAGSEPVFLCKVAPNAACISNFAHCYLITDCKRVSGQHLDATEDLEIVVMSAEETKKLMTNGGLVQAVHVAAMYYAEKLLNK